MENQKQDPFRNLNALSDIREAQANKFLQYDPLSVIKVQKRLTDTRLEGEELILSDGTPIRARDLLTTEQLEAFVRGWLPWKDHDLFKRVWSEMRRGDSGMKTEIDLSLSDEAVHCVALNDIHLWNVYFSLKDFNSKLAAIENPEDAVKMLARHPMIDEIIELVVNLTTDGKGRGDVESFRGECDVPAIGTQDIQAE